MKLTDLATEGHSPKTVLFFRYSERNVLSANVFLFFSFLKIYVPFFQNPFTLLNFTSPLQTKQKIITSIRDYYPELVCLGHGLKRPQGIFKY